jgi:cytidylate kinase
MVSVITMSRQRGSLGSYIALEVARELGWRYIDREIIESVAQEAGVSVESVEAVEARAGRLATVLRLLGARPRLPAVASASIREQEAFESRVRGLMELEGLSREAAITRIESGGPSYEARPDYLDLVTSVIAEYAAQGEAVLVGRGGQMSLRRRPGVLHVKTIARFETRVFNIIQREGVKWREAAHRVRNSDEQRSAYMRRFYNVDWLDASLYDLVINTDQITCETAVRLVVEAARAVQVAPAG